MKNLISVLIVAFLLTSCSDSVEDVLNNRREDAVSKFNQLYKCYELAKTIAPLTDDEINWETKDAIVESGESNVYQVGFESFKDLSVPLNIPYDGTRRREHADMAMLFNIDLSSHIEPHDYNVNDKYSFNTLEDEFTENAVLHFLNSKYLVLNRVVEFIKPQYISGDEYDAGFVNGDVLIFDLEKVKLLGGFVLHVKSNSNINVGEDDDVNSELVASLKSKVYEEIKRKFKNLTPFLEVKHNYHF